MDWILNTAGLYQTREGTPVTVLATDVRVSKDTIGIVALTHGDNLDSSVVRHLSGACLNYAPPRDIIPVPPKPVEVDMYVYLDSDFQKKYLCTRLTYEQVWEGHAAHLRWVDGVLEIVEQKNLGESS